MTEFLFAPTKIPALAIKGQASRWPINRIFCVGRNYEAHAREMGLEVDREAPFYFIKAAGTFVPSGSAIAYPPGTGDYHYEMELVVAIGSPAFEVSVDDALSHVYGYACGLDMTRRDLQLQARQKSRPWDLGKDFEQSAVISPIVPAVECGHPATGEIELRVNGVTRQSSELELLIHSVPEIIADLSKYYHLEPGDLIFTGTPEGVGPVVSGDHLSGSIAGVGEIELDIT